MTPRPLRRDRLLQGFIATAALSRAGDSMWAVALAWTAVHLASPAVAGLVLAAGTVPRAVVLLYGGVVADRIDSLRLLRLTNLVRTAVLATTAVIAWTSGLTIAVLVVVEVLFGVADALYNPALSTVPRQLVRPEDMAAYSGASQGVQRIGSMVGALVGGVVVAVWGAGVSAATDAVTFLVMAVFFAVVTPRFPLPRSAAVSAWQGIMAGFRYLREHPVPRGVVVSLMGLNLAIDPALDLGVALRASAEGWGAHTVGFAEGLFGLGAVVASLAFVRLKPHRIGVWGFGVLVLQGVTIMALAGGGRPLLLGVCVALGAMTGAASVSLSALFQTVIDQDYLGRMSSIQSMGDNVLMPAANAGFGGLASGVSLGAPFLVYGGAMAVLMSLVLRRRPIRSLTLPVAATEQPARV